MTNVCQNPKTGSESPDAKTCLSHALSVVLRQWVPWDQGPEPGGITGECELQCEDLQQSLLRISHMEKLCENTDVKYNWRKNA